MSDTADLSRVMALTLKGYELGKKGHNARAAEKYRLAAEEVEKALPEPDCLVTCALRNEQLEALLRHATNSAAPPADADDALREAFLRLQPSVTAVLNRRKAAGTLLPGSCRAVEETFHMALMRHSMELGGNSQAMAAASAAAMAPYVGVETYVRVACFMAYMLNGNIKQKRLPFELSDEQKHAAYLFVASAVDLMTRPRSLDSWLAGEPELVSQIRRLIPKVSDLDEPATKKLCTAWQRALRSGVLSARGIDEGIEQTDQLNARIRARVDEEVASGRLQQCALAGCAAREAHASHFKRCGACRAVCYCCREHQLEDWPSHKAACKAARKAAADPAADA